jgi:ribosomal protein L11 methylase PrmA
MADGIVANIELGLLEPLFEGLAQALAPTGWLIISGILEHEWSVAESAVASLGLGLEELDRDGEWTSGLFRKLA